MVQSDMQIQDKLEKAKTELETLIQRCNTVSWTYLTEADTITKFIHPMLSAFGWDIFNFDEVREEVMCGESSQKHADLVCYLGAPNAYSEGPTHLVMEVKSLGYGSIGAEDKASFNSIKDDVLMKSRHFGSTYAIVTRFHETLIFDTITGKQQAYLKHEEYLDKIDVLWKCLSKPEGK